MHPTETEKAQHTAGKLQAMPHADPQWKLIGDKGQFQIIALTCQGNDEANAKRLADCWNACQGIPDPASAVPALVKWAREATESTRASLAEDAEFISSWLPELESILAKL